MATYEEILKDVGHQLGLELKPDENDTCQLRVEDQLDLYLEVDDVTGDLVLATPLGELAPGKMTQSFFKASLLANDLPRPFAGRFAFSATLNQLVLFERASLLYVDSKIIFQILLTLVSEGKRWKEAILNGIAPDLTVSKQVK